MLAIAIVGGVAGGVIQGHFDTPPPVPAPVVSEPTETEVELSDLITTLNVRGGGYISGLYNQLTLTLYNPTPCPMLGATVNLTIGSFRSQYRMNLSSYTQQGIQPKQAGNLEVTIADAARAENEKWSFTVDSITVRGKRVIVH